MKNKLRIEAVSVLIMAVISGCATLPGVVTEEVKGRRIEYSLVNHGTEAVVFENGLGSTLNVWAKVFPEIAKDATVFAYNRPGYGNSESVATPRDGDHIVDELRALLRSRGLDPPYILVGHSLGGLYVQLFARRYPGEVGALVLVDSTHPAQFQGKGAPENWPAWVRAVFGVAASPTAKEELNAVNASGETVLSLAPFTGKPVIVLSALQPMEGESELAMDANEKRQQIAGLYPGSRQVWVDSGHNIPLDKPESVISAIRDALSSRVEQ